MKLSKIGFAFALLACAVFLFGCGNNSQKTAKKSVKVAVVSNSVSDFWKVVEVGVKDGAKEFGCDAEMLMPAQGTFAEQKRILEDLTAKGVDGISVSPVNPEKTDILDKLAAQTILICTDSDSPKSKRVCYVGTKNYDAGKLAGEQLIKALPNGGKVMAFVGTMDAQNAADRFNGIKDKVKGTKIEIIGVMTDATDRTKARQNVEDTLTKHNDIAALVGLWSYNGPAICRALEATKKNGKVKVVCFDEDETTLNGITSGTVYSTIVQQPYKFGYESVRVLKALAEGKKDAIPADGIIDTGALVVNKDNVDKFRTDLNTMLKKD